MVNQVSPLSRHLISPNTSTGISATMMSNRLSYFYDLRGPSFSVDTACSSSLVAFHYACQDLWNGRIDMALVGGANVMLRPEYPIAMAKGGFLSPDARCKPFDARANGYARGEGAAVMLLKPLSAAIIDGNPIYALVSGTGVNQDGHTMGITVPNFDSQKALIAQVYQEYGLDPANTVYAEAHGTGTPVGDPIEARAIGEAIGQPGHSNGEALLVGSLKANIGHTEAAAGVAGLIKAALCLSHGEVPPQANLVTLNPAIPFDDLRLKVPRAREPLPPRRGRAQASVNSFGYGGTNAHAVLTESPPLPSPAHDSPPDGRSFVTPLSARSPEALRQFALACAERLSDPTVSQDGLRRSLAFRRTHHDLRLAVVADDRLTLIARLKAFATGDKTMPGLVSGRAHRGYTRKPVFVFTGMGPQWWGMGRELLAHEPVFRAKAEEIDALFQRIAGWSILEEMGRDEETSRITRNQYAQPANFLLQVALAEVWRSWGIEPEAIVGHSVGEVSAFHVAGALSLEDAVTVSYHRSQAQQKAAGRGRMLAVGMGADEARALVRAFRGRIEVAAVNSPMSCTMAGDPDALEEMAAQLTASNVFNRLLTVEVAYHSHHMAPLEHDIRTALAALQPHAPSVPLYSSVSGQRIEGTVHAADYWWRNVRRPVLFAEAMSRLAAEGHTLFLEIGPHPVLKASIDDCLQAVSVRGTVLRTLERKQPERETMLDTIGRLYALGQPVDWIRFIPSGQGFVRYPRYPWHRETHWLESEENRVDRLGWQGHPLLGRRLRTPTPSWQTEINRTLMPWLDDHVIDGAKILPGAAYVEAALEAVRQSAGGPGAVVENVRLMQALAVPPHDVVRLRIDLDSMRRTFAIHSRSVREGAEWTLHADGAFAQDPAAVTAAPLDLEGLLARLGQGLEEATDFYRRLAERGLTYGPRFQGVQRLWSGPGEVLARLELHPEIDPAADGYGLHPTLLDASFQMMISVLDRSVGTEGAYIPVHLQRVAVPGDVGRAVWAYGRVTLATPRYVEGDIRLADDTGRIVARIDGLRCQSVGGDGEAILQRLRSWLYEYQWNLTEEFPEDGGEALSSSWLVLADRGGIGAILADRLARNGATCLVARMARDADGLVAGEERTFVLRPDSRDDMVALLTAARDAGISGVLYGWGCDDDEEDPDGSERCVALLHLMQAMRTVEMLPRLVVVTRGSQTVVDGDRPSPAQAAVWGLARTIMNEIPEVRCRSLDLAATGDIPPLVPNVIAADTEEDEFAIRDGAVYLHRLTRGQVPEETASSAVPAADASFVVEAGRAGTREAVRLRAVAPRPAGLGEVMVRLHSVTLTPADSLALAGRLPASPGAGGFFGDSVGIEASGQIEGIGADVGEHAHGDVVVPLAAGGLARSHVVLPAERVLRVPASLGSDAVRLAIGGQALTFATALLGIREGACLQPGETILVPVTHDGPALAVVQWALARGGRVIVSAADAAIRELVRRWGVEMVLDPTASPVADRLHELTAGAGIDVVVSTDVDESQETYVAALGAFGRLVHIVSRGSTRDVATAFRRLPGNGRFAAIDIDQILASKADIVRDALSEVWRGFAENRLRLLPADVSSIGDLADTVDRLTQRRGPIRTEVALDNGPVHLLPPEETKATFRRDGTYLVTGAFGGFGGEVARWMADQGAGALVLVGRQGAATADARALVADLEKRGARVMSAACDVSNRAAVAGLLCDVRAALPPVRGIFHAATVFDDRFVLGMDADGFRKVMAPKALGALNLDAETRDDPLEVFLNFSSVSSLMGKPGQCNYVAANAVLDALAWRRRAEGRPGLSVNWGVIGGVGVAARDDDLRDLLARQGIRAMPYRQAIDVLPTLLRMDAVQVGLMDVDWAANLGFLPSPRLSRFMGDTDDTMTEHLQVLRDMPPAGRHAALQTMLIAEVAETIRLPVEKIVPDVPLNQLGVDSLAAVELQTAIRIAFGVNLSQLEITTSDGVVHIGLLILDRLKFGSDGGQTPKDEVVPEPVTA